MANEGHALMFTDDLVQICKSKEEDRWRFVAQINAHESKGLTMSISKMKVMRCAQDVVSKEAAVDSCSVCGEGGCELIPLCHMWLLGAQVMFGNVTKFGESGTGFCVQSV